MKLDLRHWRERYLIAVRSNELPTLRLLVSELGAHLRSYRIPPLQVPVFVNASASWQELCLLAQDERDPEKLIALVSRINELLEQRENSSRK